MVTKRNHKALCMAAPSSMKNCKSRKLTSKILKYAYEQQKEVEDEETAETIPMSFSFEDAVYGFEDFADDFNEQYESEFGYYQDMAMASEKEDNLLDAFFNKDGSSIAKRLSDTIKELQDDVATDSAYLSESKAIDLYESLGNFMSLYSHGKMPKAFIHASRQQNWVQLLKLTQPENWSLSAMFKATNIFSNSKAERFCELFLLPRVRADIRNHKKLHFFLYQSLKKTVFRPEAFYWGIVIPLCKSGTCNNREAVIIGSIIQKLSIPEKFSSPTLVCLAEMKFCGATSYFMKLILEKKYTLAYGAIDAVTTHFLRFHKEPRVTLTIWHQTLLAFVQLYKHQLRKEDKMSLTSLIEKQYKKDITLEIVRELESSRNRGEKEEDKSNSASIINNKPIKEDFFHIPQVPMEED